MDRYFYGSPRWYHQPDPTRHPFPHSSSTGGVPVYHLDPTNERRRRVHPVKRPTEKCSGPKVVKIPVHYLGSEQVDRTASVVKIQKIFRAFLVRKCLRKIRDMKVQVDAIEEELSRSDVVELLRRDERARLRMNETLMSLLFKLDSICGVDFGVRGCRKAVIRKAITLQERIDAIVASDLNGNCENDDEVTEIRVSMETDSPIQTCSSENSREVEGNDGNVVIVDFGVDCEVVSESKGENLDLVSKGPKEGDDKGKNDNGVDDDNKINGELLERLMEDNAKMMRLMRRLCESNETQTRMLDALTHRVELLEKASVCERLRRRKKKIKMMATQPEEN